MSIKFKIALMILAILVLVAGAVGFFAKRDVERAVFMAEQRSAENVLHLADLDVQGRYKSILMERLSSVKSLKSQLTRLNGVVLSGVERFRLLSEGKKGISSKLAKKQALEWIASLAPGRDEYLFVYDKEGKALSYPEKEMIGADLSMFTDVKGRKVTDSMREEAMRRGTSSTTYYWKRIGGTEQVRTFGLFTYYPAWDWMLGTAVHIEDIERAEQRKLDQIVRILAESLEKVTIARSGFVTVFDGAGRMLVRPPDVPEDFLSDVNTLSGKAMLEDFKAAAALDNGGPLHSVPASDQAGGERESFVRYNKALDWYIATTAFSSELREPAQQLLSRLAGVFAAILLLGLATGLGVTARIARPLERLTDYARTLHEQDFLAEEQEASPMAGLAKARKDEVGRLAGAFEFMEESLRERIRELMDATAARERIESELNVAHDIQMGLLPKIFPPYPKRDEFDLFAFLEPAKEVGGDLYDFFFIDDDHLCLTLGDVSDKGVPAALFMTITMTLIRAEAKKTMDPEAIMIAVNDALSRDNPRSMFVTLFLGILDVRTGELAYANGGHNAPVRISGQQVEYLKDISGPMVGAMEDMPYRPLSTTLAPGDTLFVYTDGVTEAMNKDKDLYSDERLLETARAGKDLGPEELVGAVRADVAEHVAGAPASDDITMLCLHFKGPGA